MATGTDLTQAGETLERLARHYEGLHKAAAALKGIGSLENHVVELTAKRHALLAEIDLHKETHAQCCAEGDALKAQLADEVLACTAARAQERADAEAQAIAILARATEEATAHKAAAETVATAQMATAQGHYDTVVRAREQQDTLADARRAEVVEIEAQRDAAQAQYNKILAAIRAVTEPAGQNPSTV